MARYTKIKSLLSLFSRFRISFTNILLLLIVSFLALRFIYSEIEIRLWIRKMLPAYRTQVIKVPSECTKQVSNPEYLAQYHQLSDACEKNLEKETFDRRMLKFQAVMDCADEKARDKIKVPEKLEQKYPCEEEKQETWFWALNKYWFKIGSETK